MSGEDRRAQAPQEPPWSVDLLADLHAGALDESVAAELRNRAEADAVAREVLAALDATRADLNALPNVPMPPEVAGRIEAALQREASGRATPPGSHTRTPAQTYDIPAQPVEPAQPMHGGQVHHGQQDRSPAPVTHLRRAQQRRTFRRRAAGWGAGLVTAAATVVGVALATIGTDNATPDTPAPDGVTRDTSAPLALRGGAPTEIPPDVFGAHQYGPLAEPARLQGCLAANGIPPHTKPLGVRQITLDGKPGTLIVLTTGSLGTFRALTVGPDCAAGNPATISNLTVGN